MAINDNFVFSDPVPGQQRIQMAQLEAAQKEAQNRNIAQMLESQSRERSARYATQANAQQHDKELALRADDLKYRREIMDANLKLDKDATRDAAAKARAKLQFDTVIEKLRNNQADPPTKKEMEVLLQAGQDLTEDQKNAARSLREDVYKAAKAAATLGEQAAKNYMAELKNKKPDDPALARIHERLQKDPNVVFDLSTSQVASRYKMPREDGPDVVPGSGVRAMSGVGGASTGGARTIADVLAEAGKGKGFTPGPASVGVGVEEGPSMQPRVAPMSFGGGVAIPGRPTDVGSFIPRATDLAPPVAADTGPMLANPSPMGLLDALFRRTIAAAPANIAPEFVPRGADMMSSPSRGMLMMRPGPIPPPFMDMEDPGYIPPQRYSLPRLWDLQGTRPEFAPVPGAFYQ